MKLQIKIYIIDPSNDASSTITLNMKHTRNKNRLKFNTKMETDRSGGTAMAIVVTMVNRFSYFTVTSSCVFKVIVVYVPFDRSAVSVVNIYYILAVNYPLSSLNTKTIVL